MNLGLLILAMVRIDLHRIGTRKSPKQATNEIIEGNCILSACDSVYREIFVSHCETVSVTSKS